MKQLRKMAENRDNVVFFCLCGTIGDYCEKRPRKLFLGGQVAGGLCAGNLGGKWGEMDTPHSPPSIGG